LIKHLLSEDLGDFDIASCSFEELELHLKQKLTGSTSGEY
jgi:hypothetical protein